jgi:uncharacterized membrane protein YczE
MFGLVLCGMGIGLMVQADLGVAPWSVLDQGISRQTGLTIGGSSIAISCMVLLAWIPLRERPGIGTVLNALTIGAVIDVVLNLVSTPDSTTGRVALMALGVFLFGPGSGLYIGARLGPGPRDGLMTGLARRGIGSLRVVRTGLELGALGVGWLLGGTVGFGTLAFALTIGPNVQFFLKLFTMAQSRSRVAAEPSPAPAVA